MEFRRDSVWFMTAKTWHKIPDIECRFMAEKLHFGASYVLTITKNYRNCPYFFIMVDKMCTFPANGSLNISFSHRIHGLIFSHLVFFTQGTNSYSFDQSRTSHIDSESLIFWLKLFTFSMYHKRMFLFWCE